VTGLAAEVTESSQQPAPVPFWVRHRATLLTLAWYLLGGFYVTGRLWINPAGRWQTGDIEDVDQATWFMRYTARAVEHFHLPALMTTTLNAPHGVNLMWNTSLLLPGTVVSPVTLLFGPQVSLTVLLVIGLAGSAASMWYVLRRWHASPMAAALGGALYGFSPALVNSGIGHYSLVLAIIPPLLIDRLLRIVTGQGSPVRNGLWLGVLAAAQLFISEELLVDSIIAAVILLVVLAVSRPREIVSRLRPFAIGMAAALVAAVILSARGLWVQFHGVAIKGAGATVIIKYDHRLTNLGTLPYAWITPGRSVVLRSVGTAYSASHYPQPTPEYLAYLGVPLIILLIVAIIYFWRDLLIRVAGVTCVLLEWLGMGARQINPHAVTLPGFLLPWTYLQHLPVVEGMVPDRLCILADAGAAAVLAFALGRARAADGPFRNWQYRSQVPIGIAVFALLFLIPTPYVASPVRQVPPGWQATFTALHLPDNARVLIAPFPNADTSQVMRWQATTGQPVTMIGGDFIAPNKPGRQSRAGRSALNPTAEYLSRLYWKGPTPKRPSAAQIRADLAAMKPNAVVAIGSPGTRLGQFLISLFGQPTSDIGRVMAWRL
jgi:hypothetical protein